MGTHASFLCKKHAFVLLMYLFVCSARQSHSTFANRAANAHLKQIQTVWRGAKDEGLALDSFTVAAFNLNFIVVPSSAFFLWLNKHKALVLVSRVGSGPRPQTPRLASPGLVQLLAFRLESLPQEADSLLYLSISSTLFSGTLELVQSPECVRV